MREILFRGKRIDNGEWIEGCLLSVTIDGKTAYLIFEDAFSRVDRDVKALSHALIDPATVGMFSGMYDKTGKRIFEGDIIRTITFGFNPEMFVTAIEFKYAQFRLQNGRNLFYFGQTDWTKMSDSEVIGNIHDNPELLEG